MTVGERQRQNAVADNVLTVAHAAAGSGPSGDLVRLLAGADSAAWQVWMRYKVLVSRTAVVGKVGT